MMIIHRILITYLLYSVMTLQHLYAEDIHTPVTMDSRIKTFIYSENTIFRVVLNYNYQSYIEFNEDEIVKTIAIGDASAWKLTTDNNRLFIKPLERDIKTNLIVNTDKHSYIFDLVAVRVPHDAVDPELSYIIRFYYPDLKKQESKHSSKTTLFQPDLIDKSKVNYSYITTGAREILPIEIFDDSKLTYFKFANKDLIPQIFTVDKSGNEHIVKMLGFNDYIIIKGVHKKLSLRYKNESVIVTSE